MDAIRKNHIQFPDQMSKDKEILTLKEVAAYLNLHLMTAYELVRKGKLPAIKIGGQYRAKKSEIDKLFNQVK